MSEQDLTRLTGPPRLANVPELFHSFLQDARFGIRLLLKQPVALLSALAALALGIGLVTFMFCMVNGSLLRTLPLPDPDRVVYTTIPVGLLHQFSEQQTTFDGLAAFGAFPGNFRVAQQSERLSVCFVTDNFLKVLRAKPSIGRDFLPGEGAEDETVALLSYRVWQEQFHGNPGVLGTTVWVEDKPLTVIGVMPADFRFPINQDVWVASKVTPAVAYRSDGFVLGRLTPSATIRSARVELNLIAARLFRPARPGPPRFEPIRVGPYANALTGGLQGQTVATAAAATVLMLLTFFVLFLACVNVAMLVLNRAVKRQRELAVRSSLGATRHRLILQMLTENLVLSVGGAVLGTFAASWIKDWVLSRIPPDARGVMFWWRFDIDARVLAFVACLTVLTNMLAGLWPALQATRRDVNELLKDQAVGSSGLRLAGLQRLLIISQVAVSVTILVAAFALLENTRRLHDFHLSFDPGTAMTLAVEVPRAADTNRFFVEMQDDLARIPGVKAVALASDGFAFGHGVTAIELPGQSYVHPEDRPQVSARTVTVNYFQAANLRFVEGRGFNPDDRAGAPLVAVVNANFSKRFFPAGTAVGQCFREGSGPWLTIVGCIPDALTYGDGEREAVCYVPLAQHPRPTMNVLVRGNGNASQWLKPVVAEVARLQPDLPAPRPESVQEELDGVSRGARGASVLLTLCGTASLFLAGIGIFGLLSLSVGQRRREIGIRLALGATRGSVLWTILKQATTQIALGLTVGVCLAWGLVRTIASLLPSTVSEPGVYLAVLVVLGGVSLVAVFVPARRASRADPMQALRYE